VRKPSYRFFIRQFSPIVKDVLAFEFLRVMMIGAVLFGLNNDKGLLDHVGLAAAGKTSVHRN
jgi:hypothetical protein